MKPVAAIVEPAAVDVDLVAEQILVAAADLSRVANSIVRLRGQLEDAIATAKMRRIEIGRLLARVRPTWPKRGPNAKGWGEFLARVKLDDSTAYRYIEEFKDPDGFAQRLSGKPAEDNDSDDAVSENGERDDKPTLSLVPDPELEIEIDRDTWCTPKWITDAIGEFDLDPCANEHSHVKATHEWVLEEGNDGLEGDVAADLRVFVNPPYSDVTPWIRAYAHTRFCFLLKLDPSTKWFAELIGHTQLILIPRGTRVEFEAPPGVPRDKQNANPFPHALFYRFADDATPAIRELCFAWRVEHPTTNT